MRSSNGRSTWRQACSKTAEEPRHLLPHLAMREQVVVRGAAHLYPARVATQHGSDLLPLRDGDQIVVLTVNDQSGNADALRGASRVVMLAEHHLYRERREELHRDLGQRRPRRER